MKNFFQNSPKDSEGVQKLINDNFLFNADSKNDGAKRIGESSFVPFFSENFFNEKPSELKEEKKPLKPIVQKRLNDFDGNILRESAIFNFNDKDIRLEEKIKIAQELLKSYKEKISIMELSGNSVVKDKLVSQKEDLEGILDNLNKELKHSCPISNDIKLKINQEKQVLIKQFKKFKDLYKKKIHPYDFLYKFFPRIYQIKLMKDSLKKLRRINTLVNELAQSQTPYGENDIKYESIIAYLSSASSLHSKLKKQIGN